jgi:dipeptidyl aminopeptidase/acylaminoacyl peptidase
MDLYSRKPRLIDLGDNTDHFLRMLSWLDDGSQLLLARYNRVFSRVEVLAVDAFTGKARTLLTEGSPTFVSCHHRALLGTNPGFALLPHGSGFLWHSERDGWEHLYHYSIDGRFVRQVTRGNWPVEEVLRVDSQSGWVYFTGHDDTARPYDTHLYRVGLDGQGLERLTQGTGQHAVNIAPSARYFIDTVSSVDVPPKTLLCKADGSEIRVLADADITRLKVVGWMPPRECVIKAADGVTDLWATLFLPYDFDPGKRYPLIEHIYAGPQTTWRPREFGDQPQHPTLGRATNFHYALANLGFIVMILDGRGTPGRSKSFHDVVFRRWGQFEIDEHVHAIRELAAQLQFIDLERVGVWGMSWGGHFAFRAMTEASDLYKAGICEVPALDPYRMMLYEPYLGLPQENKAGYQAADPFHLAAQLDGELLLIGAMNDPYTQADVFKLSEALIRLGKQHRLMCYANCGHIPAGQTAEYNMELKKLFFLEHLR